MRLRAKAARSETPGLAHSVPSARRSSTRNSAAHRTSRASLDAFAAAPSPSAELVPGSARVPSATSSLKCASVNFSAPGNCAQQRPKAATCSWDFCARGRTAGTDAAAVGAGAIAAHPPTPSGVRPGPGGPRHSVGAKYPPSNRNRAQTVKRLSTNVASIAPARRCMLTCQCMAEHAEYCTLVDCS